MAKNRHRQNRPARSAEQGEALLAAGLKLHQRGQFARAEKAYKQSLIHDALSPVAHHLLGRLYYQTNRKAAAIVALQQSLAVQPENPDALLDLANMLHESGQYAQAEDCLRQLIQLRPNSAMAHNNLGVLYKDQQRFDEALEAYRRSLELDSGNASAHCNLAHTLSRIEDLDGAVQAYRQVLKLQPANIEALRCLASILRRTGRQTEAIEVFASWLNLEPDNPVPRHLLSACTNTAIPQRASDEYVREVFDQFADTFEADLAGLNYRGPTILAQGLEREFSKSQLVCVGLDAGCGTGLCGSVLRPYCGRLVGVDLSRRMLEIAANCQQYDELIESELGAYLAKHPTAFDLIASADTFGYFGELTEVFQLAHAALRPAGCLLATIELGTVTAERDITAEQGYYLQPSGRYCHRRSYVIECCEAAGFTIRSLTEDILRTEAEQAVPVIVLAARK